MARQAELRSFGRLLGDASSGIVDIVAGMHRAIAARVWGWLPPLAAPVHAVHETIASAAYSATSGAVKLASVAGAEVVARGSDPGAPAPSRTRAGRTVLSAMNGLWGDTLAEQYPALAVQMAVRVRGHDLSLTRASVARAFRSASPRLVVFVHGLGESDESWWHGPGRARSYGDRLRRDLRMSPVYVRYNSGLQVSDNGRALSGLLEALTAAWPVPLTDISLVGHSMGGLVLRSACHYGERDGAAWVAAVRTLVTLGTPHLGAPLAKGVHVADRLLSHLPETAPLARPLKLRSRGVRDLRDGRITEGDGWVEVPFLEHARHYFVAGSLTRDPGHPAGRAFGDGLVRHASASGHGRRRRVPLGSGTGVHLGGIGHLALLNHAEVYLILKGWLTTDDRRPIRTRTAPATRRSACSRR